jgi:hypothetical protein
MNRIAIALAAITFALPAFAECRTSVNEIHKMSYVERLVGYHFLYDVVDHNNRVDRQDFTDVEAKECIQLLEQEERLLRQ